MKYIIRVLILFIQLFFSGILVPSQISACQCPVTVFSKAECNKYEVIFRGKVLSVAACDNKPGVAVFEVEDLYTGSLTNKFTMLFNCNDECASPFQPGEEWIIYTRYKQLNNGFMDWCSRSRKFIGNAKEDFYITTSGCTYDSEIKYLQDSLGLHRLMKEQPTAAQHRNQLPSMTQSIIILLCSIGFIIAFYYFFNKFFK